MGIVDSDLRMTNNKTVITLVGLGFVGGFVAGALGLGGGAIFNPLLINMGVPPKVSSGTGMYMVMFSTLASSISYLIYGVLDLHYGIWLGLWSAVGGVIGLWLLDVFVSKFDR
jgi:uncharacterized membrane protein YfcA